MDLSEFNPKTTYLYALKNDQKNDNLDTIKPKEFYTVIASILAPFKEVEVRDYLDVDGTFAIVFKKYSNTPFEILDCYQSIKETLETMLYSDGCTNEGLIKFDTHEGFWVQPSV